MPNDEIDAPFQHLEPIVDSIANDAHEKFQAANTEDEMLHIYCSCITEIEQAASRMDHSFADDEEKKWVKKQLLKGFACMIQVWYKNHRLKENYIYRNVENEWYSTKHEEKQESLCG